MSSVSEIREKQLQIYGEKKAIKLVSCFLPDQ